MTHTAIHDRAGRSFSRCSTRVKGESESSLKTFEEWNRETRRPTARRSIAPIGLPTRRLSGPERRRDRIERVFDRVPDRLHAHQNAQRDGSGEQRVLDEILTVAVPNESPQRVLHFSTPSGLFATNLERASHSYRSSPGLGLAASHNQGPQRVAVGPSAEATSTALTGWKFLGRDLGPCRIRDL